MTDTFQFPIKGLYYYAAEQALESQTLHLNAPLILIPEPDNPYDPHAIQIYSLNPASQHPQFLIGYVPRILAKTLSPLIQSGHTYQLYTTHITQTGKQLQIQCQLHTHTSWLFALNTQLRCLWIKLSTTLKKLKNSFKNS